MMQNNYYFRAGAVVLMATDGRYCTGEGNEMMCKATTLEAAKKFTIKCLSNCAVAKARILLLSITLNRSILDP